MSCRAHRGEAVQRLGWVSGEVDREEDGASTWVSQHTHSPCEVERHMDGRGVTMTMPLGLGKQPGGGAIPLPPSILSLCVCVGGRRNG